MATRPILGYVNYLARRATTLASVDIVDGSDVDNLIDPNQTAIADFGVGDTKAVTADFGSGVTLQPTLLYARFRGTGWQDLTGVRIRLSNVADLSAPEKDTTLPVYFPATWPDEMPVRPIVAAFWTAVTACRYAGIDFVRTTGEDDLEVAYAYLGESVELTGALGVRTWGSSIHARDYSRKQLTGLHSHVVVAGAKERGATLKVEATKEAQIQAEWYPKLVYGSGSLAAVYWAYPDSTDPIITQSQVMLATVNLGERIEATVESYDWFSQTFELEEIL